MVICFLPPSIETAVEVDDCPIKELDRSLHNSYESESDPSTTVPEADLIDATGKNLNQQSVTEMVDQCQTSVYMVGNT